MTHTPGAADVPLDALERLWRLSSDMLVVLDPNGRPIARNPAIETVLGWSPGEMAGLPPRALVHPDDVATTEAELAKLLAGEGVSVTYEQRLRRRDGSYRRISWQASHEAGRIYAIGRDITDQVEREETARHAQKMEAIGQLTGGIAHDFNNLLTIVRSSVDFLLRADLGEARRERYLEAISDSVDRAIRITNQLLAFARRQRLDPEVFDVGERIADISELLRQLVGERIQIRTAAPVDACHVEADLGQFETALMNLATNARDAMHGEGQLCIEVAGVDRLPPIRGHAGASGEFVAVTIRDTGAGITPEQLSRIFEPFFTTKPAGRGTGLGLSQVYGFVKQSGGSVNVQSAPGAGAAFTLYLPRSHEPATPWRDAVAPGTAAPRRGQLRVLVVEDNEDVGAFSMRLLEDLGYDAVWARNAAGALELLRAPDHGFAFVFSDVVMPGMSGIELAEQLRREQPNLPVLLTSGYSAVLAEQGSRGLPLLGKPYSVRDLEKAIEALPIDRGVAQRPRRRAPAAPPSPPPT